MNTLGRLAMAIFDACGDWFLPRACVACGAQAPQRRSPVCEQCGAQMAARRIAEEDERGLVRELRTSTHIDNLVAVYAYDESSVVRRAVHALKFFGCRELGRRFGHELAPQLPGGIDVLVPVPLHRARRMERRYNQSAVIAAELGRLAGVPVRAALRRTRRTAPQSGAPLPARLTAIRGSMAADGVRGLRVCLVDDVVTTGATVDEAARALKSAGARSVVVAAAAMVRLPGDLHSSQERANFS